MARQLKTTTGTKSAAAETTAGPKTTAAETSPEAAAGAPAETAAETTPRTASPCAFAAGPLEFLLPLDPLPDHVPRCSAAHELLQ